MVRPPSGNSGAVTGVDTMKNVLVRRIYELGPPAIVEAGRRAIPPAWTGRLGILVQIASLAATGWITWITTILPRLHRLTISRLLGDALLYALLACTWSAAIALALYLLLPKSESRNMLWAILRTSAVAVWFAPATILLSHVAPAALAASLALVVTATRLLYSEWLAASPPVEEPWTNPGMFGANLPPSPVITRELGTGLAAASVLQLAVLAAMLKAPLVSGALLALTAAILTMFAITAGAASAERPTALPRSILGILLTILLAAGITVGGMHGRLVRGGKGPGTAAAIPQAPARRPSRARRRTPRIDARPPLREEGRQGRVLRFHAAAAAPFHRERGGRQFPRCVLWPEIRPEPRLVAPLPVRGGKGTGFSHPYSIPFGGEYWMYRRFFRRPRRIPFFNGEVPRPCLSAPPTTGRSRWMRIRDWSNRST